MSLENGAKGRSIVLSRILTTKINGDESSTFEWCFFNDFVSRCVGGGGVGGGSGGSGGRSGVSSFIFECRVRVERKT